MAQRMEMIGSVDEAMPVFDALGKRPEENPGLDIICNSKKIAENSVRGVRDATQFPQQSIH